MNKLFNSKCEKDYRKIHDWESKGIVLTGQGYVIQEVWKCSQCKKIIKENLEQLE